MLTLIVCTNESGYVISHYPLSKREEALKNFHACCFEPRVAVAALYEDGIFINAYAKERNH